jgi:D-glycero-beta-D-manno-heptose-7-phosphate kinase
MRILVIGETCTDVFLYGDCNRINPEAPTPIFLPKSETNTPGMAANVKRNIENFGFEVDFLTNIEEIKKIRYVDEKSNYILLRVDENDRCDRVFLPNKDKFNEYDVVVISDYDKGFLHPDDINEIAKNSKLTFIDTKKELGNWINNCNFIKINEKEYNENSKFIDNEMYDRTIITLGGRGCKFKDKTFPGKKVEVRDVVGAGDTFLSALSLKYCVSKDIEEAIDFANICSADVIKKRGVSVTDIEF